MTNRSVPLPLQDFLDIFLPVSLDQRPKCTTATLREKFSVLDKAKCDSVEEAVVSETFVSSPTRLTRYEMQTHPYAGEGRE